AYCLLPTAYSLEASNSAKCIARTVEFLRANLPPICIKQLASADTTARTSAFSIASILLSRIATEISGYYTEKVPQKPQQVSAFDNSTNSAPRTLRIRWRGSL